MRLGPFFVDAFVAASVFTIPDYFALRLLRALATPSVGLARGDAARARGRADEEKRRRGPPGQPIGVQCAHML